MQQLKSAEYTSARHYCVNTQQEMWVVMHTNIYVSKIVAAFVHYQAQSQKDQQEIQSYQGL